MLVDIVDNYINVLNINFLSESLKVENSVEPVLTGLLIKRLKLISTNRRT